MGPLEESLVGRRDEERRLRDELAGALAELQAAEAAVHEAAALQAAAEAEQEAAREAQVGLLGRIATLQNSRAFVSGNAERAHERPPPARRRAGRARARAGAGERRPRERPSRGATRRKPSPPISRADVTKRRRGPPTPAERAEALSREVETLQSERDGLAGRRASLEEMIATHAAFDEGVRALLGHAADEADPQVPVALPEGIGVLGVVADAVETASEHERAVEAFLGERLQAVLVPDAAQALRGIRWLESSGAGRGAFLPLASASLPANGTAALRDVAGQEPRAQGLLSDLYRVSGPHAERIRDTLPDALVVDSLEDALDIVTRRGALPIATLAGETLRGPLVEGGRSVKGLLAPRREAREIAARQAEIEGRLQALRATHAEAVGVGDTAAGEAREIEERIHAAEKDLVAVGHELQTAEEESARLERKGSILDTERRVAEEERGTAAVRLAEIEQALAAAEAERAAGHERLAGLAARVGEARGTADGAQGRHAEARSAQAALRERLAATENDCRRLDGDLAELRQRIEGTRARAAETATRRAQLQAELAEVERLLSEALVGRDGLTGEVALSEDRVREVRGELEGREQGLKERRRERDVLRDALAEVEVARARNGSDLDHLARECHQAVGQTAAEAAATLTEEDRAREIASLDARIEELRQKLERMGAVNVLAVEQAQELDERHTFLTAQRQDLLDSIAELDHAIKKIDRASRERFQEAFQVINQHFSETFRQLFGGGTAGLSLIDETDLLESGIDVMAQPPGKRLQNVMLLSGGEKALTAIALLFAIFQYKPSPFCILDEVDAPLDDANIGRFVKMLEGLKEGTQFVLITHSRKTMSIADQLYGVTMEEPGVSKLVSVRFT